MAAKQCLELNCVQFTGYVGEMLMYSHDTVKQWIDVAEATCDEITYPDLSDLIKQFI
jgi:hypothetical protein